jgi:hypothetical protein
MLYFRGEITGVVVDVGDGLMEIPTLYWIYSTYRQGCDPVYSADGDGIWLGMSDIGIMLTNAI